MSTATGPKPTSDYARIGDEIIDLADDRCTVVTDTFVKPRGFAWGPVEDDGYRYLYPGTPRKPKTRPGPWELQRYDGCWGGYRAVPRAFNDDGPAVFDDDQAALAAARGLLDIHLRTPDLRLRHNETGQVIRLVLRDGELTLLRPLR